MEHRHNPPSLEELKAARKPIKNTRRELRESLSPLQRFAVWMTRRVGSMGFFLFLLLWTIVWLGWNIYGPVTHRFDPAPAFVIWLFASNILQLILLPLIMVGQNIESRAADKRASDDFDINQKAEREVEAILQHLENVDATMRDISKKLE